MSMFLKDGSWWLKSITDPKWYRKGKDAVGGLSCPPAAMKAIEEMKEEFGEEPPEDLEYGYMKD